MWRIRKLVFCSRNLLPDILAWRADKNGVRHSDKARLVHDWFFYSVILDICRKAQTLILVAEGM